MKKLISLISSSFVLRILWIGFFLFPISNYNNDPTFEEFLKKYDSDLSNIRSESELKSFVRDAINGIGVTSALSYFMEQGFSDAKYSLVIEYLVETRIPGVTRGPLVAYYPSQAEQIITTYKSYAQNAPYGTMNSLISKLSVVASLTNIGIEAFDAWNGQDEAKLKAIKNTYMFMYEQAMIRYGDYIYGGNLLNGFVILFDMALTTTITSTFTYHENLVYAAYEDFLTNKHSKQDWITLVTDPNTNDAYKKAKVDEWLYEFWESPDENFRQYLIDIKKEGLIATFGMTARVDHKKQEFASKYFETYLKSSILNELRRMKNQIEAQLKMDGQILLNQAIKLRDEAAWLKSELDKIKILDPEKDNLEKDKIVKIKAHPIEATIREGESVNFSVMGILEDGSVYDISEEASISGFDNQKLGQFVIDITYEGHQASAKVNVVTDPKLEVSPSELELDINQPDKEIAFTATFYNEYGQSQIVTNEVFDAYYGTNVMLFDNAGKYDITVYHNYKGVSYSATAIVNVSGCNDPDKIVNETNGACICDESRGYFPSPDDPDVCVNFKEIIVTPNIVEGYVGEEFLLDVLKVKADGSTEVVEKIIVTILEEGRQTGYHIYEGFRATYTMNGLMEGQEDNSEDCESPRKEKKPNGNCECKEEYVDDGKGNCMTYEEMEEETLEDSDEEDCEKVVKQLSQKYQSIVAMTERYLNNFKIHTEFATKLLNDNPADPCNDKNLASSLDALKNARDGLIQMETTIADELFSGSEEASNCLGAFNEYTLQLSDILESLNYSDGLFESLTSRLQEFNCKDEDFDELLTDALQDPDRNPSNEVIVGETGTIIDEDGVIDGIDDIVVSQRDVEITVWDHGCFDGDIVTILINNQPFISNLTITLEGYTKGIILPKGNNTITVIAVDSGTDCPPQEDKSLTRNSASISITHAIQGGSQRWELKQGGVVTANFIVQE